MFIRVGRLEVWAARTGHRDVLPKVALGGDPVGRSAWLWWMGREVVVTWMPRRRAAAGDVAAAEVSPAG